MSPVIVGRAAFIIAFMALSVMRADAQDRPRILIVKKVSGAISAGTESDLVNGFAGGIRKMYPCAIVRTMDEVKMLVQLDRERTLLNASGADRDVNEFLSNMLAADLVFELAIGTTGTTHNNPGRFINTTGMDMRKGAARHRDRQSGDGWDWKVDNLLEETLKGLTDDALYVCPFVGKIIYERYVSMDSVETQGTETITSSEHGSDNWTFELKRRRLRGVVVTTTGSSKSKTFYEYVGKQSNVTCFNKNGQVTSTGASQEAVVHKDFEGQSSDTLLAVKVQLIQSSVTFGAQTFPVFTVSVEGGAAGEASAKEYEEVNGGCGNTHEDKLNMPPIFAQGLGFSIHNLKPTDNELATTITLPATPFTKEYVEIKLSRK